MKCQALVFQKNENTKYMYIYLGATDLNGI